MRGWQGGVGLLLVLWEIYHTAMSQTLSLRKDMCSSFDTVVSQGLLTTPSYPDYTPITRCQCQLTAKDDVNIQLKIQLGERSEDGECVPQMWVSRSQHHSFHVCPSQDTNSSVLLTLEEGQTVWITLTSQTDHQVMGFVQFKAYPSPHSVNVYCKGVNGIYRKPLPKTGMSKEGIAVQVITAILIVTAVVAVYLKYKWDRKKKTKSKEKLNRTTLQVEDSHGDNPAFERSPNLSYNPPVQEGGVTPGDKAAILRRPNGQVTAPHQSSPNQGWTTHPPSVSTSPLHGQGQLGPVGFTNKAFRLSSSTPGYTQPYNGPEKGTSPYHTSQSSLPDTNTTPKQLYNNDQPRGLEKTRPAHLQDPAPSSQIPARPALSKDGYTEKRPPATNSQPHKKKKRPRSQQQAKEQPLAPSHPPVSDNPQYGQNRSKPHVRPTAAFNVSANDIRFIDEADVHRVRPPLTASSVGTTRPYISSPAHSSVYGTPPESPTGLKQHRYPYRGTETMI